MYRTTQQTGNILVPWWQEGNGRPKINWRQKWTEVAGVYLEMRQGLPIDRDAWKTCMEAICAIRLEEEYVRCRTMILYINVKEWEWFQCSCLLILYMHVLAGKTSC